MEQESYGKKIGEDITQAADLDEKTRGYIEPQAEFKLAKSESDKSWGCKWQQKTKTRNWKMRNFPPFWSISRAF